MSCTPPQPSAGADASKHPRVNQRFVRLLDALCRGASPPGVIDIVHTRHSHLRRRFTMIARYDGKGGRFPAAGLAVSLLIAGVALTGAVNAQVAAPPAQPRPDAPAASAPGATPSAAEPAPARPVSARPATPPPADGVAEAGEAAPEDVDQALLAQLDQKLAEMNFDAAGLADVIDFLRDVTGGANIVVEWGWLEQAGVDRKAPVTLRVKNVKFGRALDLVLSSAAANVPLGYTVDGNIIRISTREHLDSISDVRVYDVRDIIASEVQIQDLTKLITESVAPDSWRDSGGSVGVIRPTRNKLVVSQTPMNHREIRSVLQMLRQQPHEPAPAADAASAAQAPAATPGPGVR